MNNQPDIEKYPRFLRGFHAKSNGTLISMCLMKGLYQTFSIVICIFSSQMRNDGTTEK